MMNTSIRSAMIIVAALLGCYVLSLAARGLGIGPFWVEYTSPSGIEYACMYETEQDFITITLEETYHEKQDP